MIFETMAFVLKLALQHIHFYLRRLNILWVIVALQTSRYINNIVRHDATPKPASGQILGNCIMIKILLKV